MTDTTLPSATITHNANGQPALSSTLNVLTILTFIGCGIGTLLVLLTPVINKFFLGFIDKAKSSGRELTAKELGDIEKTKSLMELSQANLVPLMAVGLVSMGLCLAGAIMMRKLKKDGFWVYTGGELLPLIANFIILGMVQFTGVMAVVFGVGLPLLFVILYASQRKYLVN